MITELLAAGQSIPLSTWEARHCRQCQGARLEKKSQDELSDIEYEKRYRDDATCKNNPLIILTGPTAVGKTQACQFGLAKAIGGEIISADSMQVYKHMDIGSAKITSGRDARVSHIHLIDELEPD